MQPHPSNTRVACEQVMAQAAGHAPVFSVQQEYHCQLDPLGGLPSSFGPYGIGPGPRAAFGGSFGSRGTGAGAAKMPGFNAAGGCGALAVALVNLSSTIATLQPSMLASIKQQIWLMRTSFGVLPSAACSVGHVTARLLCGCFHCVLNLSCHNPSPYIICCCC